MRLKRRRTRRRAGANARRPWGRIAVEVIALGSAALAGTVAALGRLADVLSGAAGWLHLVGFATAILGLGVLTAACLTGWLALRLRLARWTAAAPATVAIVVAGIAAWLASGPGFQADVASLRTLVGGRFETQRETIAHQVYAAYRRSDLTALQRLLERARVYEPTILEAAAAYDVDPEVLMGVAAAESAFYPRDSADGGRGLFQITAPPTDAVADVKRRLRIDQLVHRPVRTVGSKAPNLLQKGGTNSSFENAICPTSSRWEKNRSLRKTNAYPARFSARDQRATGGRPRGIESICSDEHPRER